MSQVARWDSIYNSGKEYTSIEPTLLSDLLARICEVRGTRPTRILDVGCGTGDLTLKLACKGIDTSGIDVSTVALNIARYRATALPPFCAQPQFIQADFETDAVEGSFDVVFMKLVLPFIGDLVAAFRKAKGLLAKRGVLVVITPVLLKDVKYSDHMKSISIDRQELEATLRDEFVTIEEYSRRDLRDGGVEIVYLACSGGLGVASRRTALAV